MSKIEDSSSFYPSFNEMERKVFVEEETPAQTIARRATNELESNKFEMVQLKLAFLEKKMTVELGNLGVMDAKVAELFTQVLLFSKTPAVFDYEDLKSAIDLSPKKAELEAQIDKMGKIYHKIESVGSMII